MLQVLFLLLEKSETRVAAYVFVLLFTFYGFMLKVGALQIFHYYLGFFNVVL